mmetsp:Transcript_4129/g.7007  ORF Transcript_4129/g.7007 Transcript_4129/m.7007 type:complete len:693 (+) Transcript_4129:92-2170(+)
MEEIERTTSLSDDIENNSSSVEEYAVRSRKLGAMTIHEQMHVRDTRREQRLKKMKERQFDQPTLHQLFRIFDSSNSNLLSLSDFQTGLIAMGFREAEDIEVVSKIMAEIDDDRSGNINENEFVSYFLRRRLADLGRRLHEVASLGTSTTVQLVEYGVLDDEFHEVPSLRMSDDADIEQLQGLLDHPSAASMAWASSQPRRWFNVSGYHTDTLMLFSQRYGIHEETMKDAGIFQRQKIELLTPGPAGVDSISPSLSAATPLSSSVIHPAHALDQPMTLRNTTVSSSGQLPAGPPFPPPAPQPTPDASTHSNANPLFPRIRTSSEGTQLLDEHNGLGGSAHATIIIHKLDSFPPLQECVWDRSGSGALHCSPDPSMIISQYAIYSINNFMLLTVSKDFVISPPEVHNGDPEDSAGHNKYGRIGEKKSNDLRDTPERHPWEELKQRIRSADADVRVNSSSAKYLTFCAMEVIMEHNYTLRDLLKQWLGDLEREIQQRSAAHHTLHLYEFSKFATTYLSELRAMATCLEPIYDTQPREVGPEVTEALDELRGEEGTDCKAHPRRGRNAKDMPTLAHFFNNEYIFFRDLTDEIETICSDVEEMITTAKGLSDYYRAVQDDRTNRTLYILTLVTSIFVPAQFLTGLYGMNFEHMPELGWRYSYVIFWVIVVLTTVFAAVWVRRSFTSGMVSGRQMMDI